MKFCHVRAPEVPEVSVRHKACSCDPIMERGRLLCSLHASWCCDAQTARSALECGREAAAFSSFEYMELSVNAQERRVATISDFLTVGFFSRSPKAAASRPGSKVPSAQAVPRERHVCIRALITSRRGGSRPAPTCAGYTRRRLRGMPRSVGGFKTLVTYGRVKMPSEGRVCLRARG